MSAGYGFPGGFGNQGGHPSGGAYGPPGGAPGSLGPVGGGYAPQAGYGGSPTNQYNNSGGYPVNNSGAYGETSPMMISGRTSEVSFAASCCLIVGSLASGIAFISSFKFADWLFMTYVFGFSLMLAVVDAPMLGNVKWVTDGKMYIGKFLQLVARSTGKGLAFVFLGSALSMSMWDNLDGVMWKFLAVVLSGVPILVGLFCIGYGFLKSTKLEKARKNLEMSGDHRFDTYARQGGLTMTDFGQLMLTDCNSAFDSGDLQLIFNALCSNPKWKMQGMGVSQSGYQAQVDEPATLSKQDFIDWCKGGMVLL